MERTLNLLKTLTAPELEGLTLEELASMYTGGLSPSVFSVAFTKVYKLAIRISQKFFGFCEEDIVSFTLEELDKSLQLYQPGNCSFITFFATMLNNRLRMESEALTTQKRKAFLFSDSYEQLVENGFDVCQEVNSTAELLESLSCFGLTERELAYCNLVIQDYKNSEIAKMFGVSVMTLSNMRKQLRIKLAPLNLQFT